MDQYPSRRGLHLVALLINNFYEDMELKQQFSPTWEGHIMNLYFKTFYSLAI